MDKIREELSDLCHQQWSGWMEYQFEKSSALTIINHFVNIKNEEDVLSETFCVIPKWAEERWQKQLKTKYEDLSEEEKNSDRKEADKILNFKIYEDVTVKDAIELFFKLQKEYKEEK